MTVRDSHCFRSCFSHSSAGCLKQFKNYNSPSSHAAFPWPPWLSSSKGFSSTVHEVLRCILSLTSKKYHSESSASKHFVRWNTLSKFLFTSPRLRRVLNTNKQGEYPCQREAKELGSHPCKSKDRFYSLFSQQPGPEELPEAMTFPSWVLNIGDHVLDYSHPMDMAVSTILGRNCGSAQTSNMRDVGYQTWFLPHQEHGSKYLSWPMWTPQLLQIHKSTNPHG